jgi:hypothetical protein
MVSLHVQAECNKLNLLLECTLKKVVCGALHLQRQYEQVVSDACAASSRPFTRAAAAAAGKGVGAQRQVRFKKSISRHQTPARQQQYPALLWLPLNLGIRQQRRTMSQSTAAHLLLCSC